MKRSKQVQRGMTLIELMITLFLVVLIFFLAVRVFISLSSNYQRSIDASERASEIYSKVVRLQTEIQSAGFPNGLTLMPWNEVRYGSNLGLRWQPLDHSVVMAETYDNERFPFLSGVASASDLLVLQSASEVALLDQLYAQGEQTIAKIDGMAAGDWFVITDGQRYYLDQITAVEGSQMTLLSPLPYDLDTDMQVLLGYQVQLYYLRENHQGGTQLARSFYRAGQETLGFWFFDGEWSQFTIQGYDDQQWRDLSALMQSDWYQAVRGVQITYGDQPHQRIAVSLRGGL